MERFVLNQKKKKSNDNKKSSIFLKILIITVSLGFAIGCTIIETKGVTINGVHVYAHEICNYKSIVEGNLKPVIFSEHNDILTKDFKYHISDEYDFNIKDIGNAVDLKYTYSFDIASLKTTLEELNKNSVKSENAYIDINSEQIVDEIYGTEIDIDKLINSLNGNDSIVLSDFYVKPTVTTVDLQDNIDLLNEYRNWKVTYKNSDIVLTAPKDAVSINKDGDVIINSNEFLMDYMQQLCDEFNTIGKSRNFRTTNGDIVEISGGTFGDIMDEKQEYEELCVLFGSHESQIDRTPIYELYRGEIGNTYVEVSIDDQHVWFYKDGNLLLDTDCVTGKVSSGADTPKGYWYMDFIQKNRTLWPKGATSGSFVNRWMRFTPDGCGLHDASWRNKFGGEIYKYNGSHGCVNCPKQFAYDLYEYAYLGLPVVVY